MRTRIMDHQQIADLYLRQHAVDGKLIVVLTQGPRDIIFAVTGLLLLPHNGNMMIRPVHCRTHQVYGTGVNTDVFFVCVLLMDRLSHQTAVRPEHEPPKFRIDRHIPHSFRYQHFLIYSAHAVADHTDIVRLLIRRIRNPDPARQIDELNMYARLPLKLHSRLKQDLRKHRIILVRDGIARQERMDPEFFGPLFLQDLERLE